MSFHKYILKKQSLRDINVKYGQSLNISDIISSNDLLKLNEPKAPNKKVIIKNVEIALEQLDGMRKTEGAKILEDIMKSLYLLILIQTKLVQWVKNNQQNKTEKARQIQETNKAKER